MDRMKEIRLASDKFSRRHPGIKKWLDIAFELGVAWDERHPVSRMKERKERRLI